MPLAAPIILQTLSYLPAAFKAGVDIAALARQAISGNTLPPQSDVERFAEGVLSQVGEYIATGADVYSILTHAQQQVALMQSENRGPTDAEWAELNAKIQSDLKTINANAVKSAAPEK